jgi:hypothetical protein
MSDAARDLRAEGAAAAPPLRALQSWLLDVVTHPVSVSDGVLVATENVPRLGAHDADSLIEGGRLPAAERLAVYRTGYFSRLIECLADDYPTLRDALGEDVFEALCKDFIDAHPPRSASLNHYGAPFAAYCATRSEPWHAVAADLARLEWALVGAIHANAERVLEPDDLARLTAADWERLRLRPSPALRVLALDYPVNRLYRARQDGRRAGLRLRRRRNLLAVCRRDTDLWRVPIEPVLEPLLSALCAGQPLSQAIALLVEAPARGEPEPSRAVQATLLCRVRAALRDWVSAGFFSGVQ